MELKDIKKKLVKQKDPLKYLEKLLKKTKDKKLIEEIEKLIERLKSLQKNNLENIVKYAPRVEIEEEPRIERASVTRATIPSIALQVDEKKQEDYGIKPGKADYDLTTEKVKHNLQESHLITEHGFTSGAETRQIVDQKMGEYSTEKQFTEEQPKYQRFEHIQENKTGFTALEKEIKDKKNKFKPDYK